MTPRCAGHQEHEHQIPVLVDEDVQRIAGARTFDGFAACAKHAVKQGELVKTRVFMCGGHSTSDQCERRASPRGAQRAGAERSRVPTTIAT